MLYSLYISTNGHLLSSVGEAVGLLVTCSISLIGGHDKTSPWIPNEFGMPLKMGEYGGWVQYSKAQNSKAIDTAHANICL